MIPLYGKTVESILAWTLIICLLLIPLGVWKLIEIILGLL